MNNCKTTQWCALKSNKTPLDDDTTAYYYYDRQ